MNPYVHDGNKTSTIIDFNSDGAPDLLAEDGSVALNRRDGLLEPAPDATELGSMDLVSNPPLVVDFDHDGRQDLLVHGQTSWLLLRNVPGTMGVSNHLALSDTIISNIPNGGVRYVNPAAYPIIADVNGDGSPDIFAINSSNDLVVMYGPPGSGGLLNHIDNGEGLSIDIAYDETTNGIPTYKPSANMHQINGCAWPTECVRRPGPLVSAHTVFQDVNGSRVPQQSAMYSYEDGRTGDMGFGWLGFAHRTINNSDGAGLVSTTQIDYDNSNYDANLKLFPTAGKILKIHTETLAESSLPLSSAQVAQVTDIDNSWGVLTSDANMPFVRLLSTQKTVSENVNGPPAIPVWAESTTFEAFSDGKVVPTYDSYGNPTSSLTDWLTFGNNSSTIVAQRRTATTYDHSGSRIGAWQISLQQHVVVTEDRGSDEQTRTTDYGYYDSGLLQTVTREQGDPANMLVTTYLRKPATGVLDGVSAVDFNGNTRSAEIVYDDQDLFPTDVFDAVMHHSQVRYDNATGDLVAVVDPNGIAEQWQYDGFGRIRQHVRPGENTRVDYSEGTPDQTEAIKTFGRLRVETTTTNGQHTIVDKDPLDRVVRSVTSGLLGHDVKQEFEYNNHGLISRQSRPHLAGDASQGITTFAYDGRLRLIARTEADTTKVTKYAYATPVSLDSSLSFLLTTPEASSLEYQLDTKQNPSIAVRDPMGGIVTSIDESLQFTQYGYGAGNLVASVRDSLNNTTSIFRDKFGHVRELDDPDLGGNLFIYDAFGQVTTHIDGTGSSTSFHRDPIGRVFQTDDADGTTHWTFDGPSPNSQLRLSESSSPSGQHVAYQYEAPSSAGNRGFLTGLTYSNGQTSATVSVHYDPSTGLADKITYPSAGGQDFSVAQTYDAHGNVVSVSNPSTGEVYWQLLQDDQGYRIGHEQLGNGLDTRRDYYPLTGNVNHIITMKGADQRQYLFYHYDPADNVDIRQDRALTGGALPAETFEYDGMDRLKTRTLAPLGGSGSQVTESFSYDTLGNVSTSPIGTYSYNHPVGLPHAVSAIGGNNYGYDNAGNLLTRSGPNVPGGSQTFQYTAFNLPRSITVGTGSSNVTTFDYDASHARVGRHDSQGDTTYVPEFYERRTMVNAPTSVEHVYRVYAGGREVAQVQRVEQNGAIVSTNTLYLHDDALGSTNVISDEGGNAVTVQRFTPFGKNESSSSGTSGVLTGFTGQQDETALGLVYMRGRFYDPIIGRFTTPDPIVQAPYWSQGLNRYTYAFNNFLKWTDPSGFDDAGDAAVTNPITLPPVDIVVYIDGGTATSQTDLSNPNQASAPPEAAQAAAPAPVGPSGSGMEPGYGDYAPGGESTAYSLTQTPGPIWNVNPSSPAPKSISSYAEQIGVNVVEGVGCAAFGCGMANAPELNDKTYPAMPETAKILASSTLAMRPGALALGAIVGVLMRGGEEGFAYIVGENMSARATVYQSRVSGLMPGVGYVVGGVKFDGYIGGVLVEAKGPGFAQWVQPNGLFKPYFSGAGEFMAQAQRQLAVAGGRPIEWHFAEEAAANATRTLFQQNGISGINVLFSPR
jgi:RHS repeat-associated protein